MGRTVGEGDGRGGGNKRCKINKLITVVTVIILMIEIREISYYQLNHTVESSRSKLRKRL